MERYGARRLQMIVVQIISIETDGDTLAVVERTMTPLATRARRMTTCSS